MCYEIFTPTLQQLHFQLADQSMTLSISLVKCGQSAGCCFKPWFLIQYYLYDLTSYTSVHCLKFQVLDNTIDKVAAEVLTAEELKERELKKQVGYRVQIHLLVVYFLIPRLPLFLRWLDTVF